MNEIEERISLAAARVNANLTQREAAKLIGISRAALQSYEAGKTSPNIVICRKMENVYHIPVDCMRFGKE